MRVLPPKVVAFGVAALASVVPISMSVVPAQAQDLFGFLRVLFRPVAPVPSYQPFDYRSVPALERYRLRPRPKAIRLEQPATPMPVKPKVPGEVANPLPDLLTDSTLQRGDLVMFPDGLRVFTGQLGSQHALADFKPVSPAGKSVSPATRKLLATFPPGVNPAWRAESSSMLAVVGRVGTTGSVRRTGR
jgi:hypothetical protein